MTDKQLTELDVTVTPAPTDLLGVRQSGDSEDKSQLRSQIHALELLEKFVVPIANVPALPPYAFGDGTYGFYSNINDVVQLGIANVSMCSWTAAQFQMAAPSGPSMRNLSPTELIPSLVPNKADLDTGIGRGPANDQLMMISGGVAAFGLRELNSGVVQVPSASQAITAFAGGGQGSATALIHSYNVITVVATAGDSVRLPDVFDVNSVIYIKNDDAAEAADVFPASGDDLGAGVDTAVSLAAGSSLTFIATAANSTWSELIVGGVPNNIVAEDLLLNETPGDHAASPTLAFGTGVEGFYSNAAGFLSVAIAGVREFAWGTGLFQGIIGGAASMLNVATLPTLPTLLPFNSDTNTGIAGDSAGGDQLSVVTGGVEAVRWTELASQVLMAPDRQDVVADAVSETQASATIINSSLSRIDSDGGSNSVKLPTVFALDTIMEVTYVDPQDSEAGFTLFPGIGDDLGAGANVADPGFLFETKHSRRYIATVANSTWAPLPNGATSLISLTAGGPAVLDKPATNGDPVLLVNKDELGTGLTQEAVDEFQINLRTGAWLRLQGSGGQVLEAHDSTNVVANAGGGQGSATEMLNSYMRIITVVTTGDSVRLPTVFKVGCIMEVHNNAVNAADIFPASGDDLGAGTDTAVSLAVEAVTKFRGVVANTTWVQVF